MLFPVLRDESLLICFLSEVYQIQLNNNFMNVKTDEEPQILGDKLKRQTDELYIEGWIYIPLFYYYLDYLEFRTLLYIKTQ